MQPCQKMGHQVSASGNKGLDECCAVFLKAWLCMTAVICTWFQHGAGRVHGVSMHVLTSQLTQTDGFRTPFRVTALTAKTLNSSPLMNQ